MHVFANPLASVGSMGIPLTFNAICSDLSTLALSQHAINELAAEVSSTAALHLSIRRVLRCF